MVGAALIAAVLLLGAGLAFAATDDRTAGHADCNQGFMSRAGDAISDAMVKSCGEELDGSSFSTDDMAKKKAKAALSAATITIMAAGAAVPAYAAEVEETSVFEDNPVTDTESTQKSGMATELVSEIPEVKTEPVVQEETAPPVENTVPTSVIEENISNPDPVEESTSEQVPVDDNIQQVTPMRGTNNVRMTSMGNEDTVRTTSITADNIVEIINQAEDNATIELTDNLDLDFNHRIGNIINKTVTIDLKNFTITYTKSDDMSAQYTVLGAGQGGQLILIGTGTITSDGNATLGVANGGELVISDGVHIVNTAQDGIGVYMTEEDGYDGGVLTVSEDGSVIGTVGIYVEAGDAVNVDGGTVTGSTHAIYVVDTDADVVVSNGTVTAEVGGITSAGDVAVSGGVVQATGVNGYGAGVYSSKLTVTDGTITGGAGSFSLGKISENADAATAEISGGIFSAKPTVDSVDGTCYAQVTTGDHANLYRVLTTTLTADGWDLSAISGNVTVDGNRFPTDDATISFAWAGSNDVVTLAQTYDGSTDDGFFITWTKNEDNNANGVSTQALLFAASADDRPSDPGSYTGTITGTGAYAGMSGSVTMTINAQDTGGNDEWAYPIQMVDCTITVDPAEVAYTGLPVTPSVTVTSPAEGVLTEGKDYWLNYRDNILPGTATVEVWGMGNYCSVKSLYFTISSPTVTDEPGKWGTCAWELSADGVLTVHAGTGCNTAGKSPWKDVATQVKRVVFEPGVIAPSDCSRLLSGFTALESVDLSGFDASAMVCMDNMFWICRNLTSLDFSKCGSPQVVSMASTFAGCQKLANLNLGSIDTSKAKDLSGLFSNCKALESLDLTGFDTNSVQLFTNMFHGCSSLNTVYVSGAWSTSGVLAN